MCINVYKYIVRLKETIQNQSTKYPDFFANVRAMSLSQYNDIYDNESDNDNRTTKQCFQHVVPSLI